MGKIKDIGKRAPAAKFAGATSRRSSALQPSLRPNIGARWRLSA